MMYVKRTKRPTHWIRVAAMEIPSIAYQVGSKHTMLRSTIKVSLSFGLFVHLKMFKHIDAIPAKKVNMIEKKMLRVREYFMLNPYFTIHGVWDIAQRRSVTRP